MSELITKSLVRWSMVSAIPWLLHLVWILILSEYGSPGINMLNFLVLPLFLIPSVVIHVASMVRSFAGLCGRKWLFSIPFLVSSAHMYWLYVLLFTRSLQYF